MVVKSQRAMRRRVERDTIPTRTLRDRQVSQATIADRDEDDDIGRVHVHVLAQIQDREILDENRRSIESLVRVAEVAAKKASVTQVHRKALIVKKRRTIDCLS